MKSNAVCLLAFLVFLATPGLMRADESEPVIQNVVDQLKRDLVTMDEFGAHQRIITTKLDERGEPKRIEEKDLRTVWVHNKQQNQLINYSCNEFDSKSGKSRRCSNVKKAGAQQPQQQKDSKPGKIESEIKKVRWTELHRNFQFTMLASEGPYFVIGFKPRGTMSPQNRIEKLLCSMGGKVWIDRQFNVVKAEANLIDTVSFGWGVAAKVHHLAIRYSQQHYRSVWLPSSLTVDFKAKVALVHNERQRIEVFWTGPYRKSDAIWAQALPLNVSKSSSRR
jgi:hypothetical protein